MVYRRLPIQVLTQQCTASRHVDHKSDALTTTPPNHLVVYLKLRLAVLHLPSETAGQPDLYYDVKKSDLEKKRVYQHHHHHHQHQQLSVK